VLPIGLGILDWQVCRFFAKLSVLNAIPLCPLVENMNSHAPKMFRKYTPRFSLKYGCNPHQDTAAIHMLGELETPFKVLNGQPGYINLLDALNAWQLVRELDEALDLPAAASFKHVSPAGAAVGVELDEALEQAYGLRNEALSPLARAYARARGADPMSSFGDFIALSRRVDESTAQLIRTQVSDGIIAPGYDQQALEVLQGKKKGQYLVLQAQEDYTPPTQEFREVFGVGFEQTRNHVALNEQTLLSQVVTQSQEFSDAARRDLVLASITLKYTQSNSVGYALGGQMIGIGAGQQSRVDCTKLAGRKADLWFLRQHPKVQALPFAESVKGVDRTNARIAYIEGEMTPPERVAWEQLLTASPEPLSAAEREGWLSSLEGVSLSSDAFLPFRDNIDQASRHGVKFIVQPGGSARDDAVIAAANEYGMTMAFSGIRLFHH
jgi:phosphoribosylaminoimidazolecarboxamide formyltransferase/IMP cyclohydrolase